jgi:hypothetical protein
LLRRAQERQAVRRCACPAGVMMRHSLVRAGGAFLRPGQASSQRRAQARSRMAARPPRSRRVASLTAPRT